MLTQNDPFRVFDALFDQLGTSRPAAVAPMDAYRRGEDVWLHLDLPGVASDSIDIDVERNMLTITAERSWARQEGDQVYVTERRQGAVRRQVSLGEGLDLDGVEAAYHDGVLTLRIPVAEQAKPRKISIASGEFGDHAAIETDTIETDKVETDSVEA